MSVRLCRADALVQFSSGVHSVSIASADVGGGKKLSVLALFGKADLRGGRRSVREINDDSDQEAGRNGGAVLFSGTLPALR